MRINTGSVLLICGVLLSACGVDISGTPPFEDLTFSDGYEHIASGDGRTWDVDFEYPTDSAFTGVVRHASRWHDSSVPFMTHDILVTTGDFASSEFVDVAVIDHKFFYRYDDQQPEGSINLLHVFPASQEVFDQLKEIKTWNNVTLSGREIFMIHLYDEAGKNMGFFTDMGCNTILVTSVTIHAEGTPIP